MELIEEIALAKDPADEVVVKLITSEATESPDDTQKQVELLAKVRAGVLASGIQFEVSFEGAIHDRSIVTDTGWKILLGRGLDIFQYFRGDAFEVATRRPELRKVKSFGVTYILAAT